MICRHSFHLFRLARAAVASVLSAVVAGCGSGTEVPTSPLDHRAASSDTGTVYGQVVLPARRSATVLGVGFGAPLEGATVELGTWRGSATEFRDSTAHVVRVSPDDPRFVLIAGVVTNELGEYRFPGVPKKQVLAMRARPPAGSGYETTYFESLFWLFTSKEMRLTVMMRRSSR